MAADCITPHGDNAHTQLKSRQSVMIAAAQKPFPTEEQRHRENTETENVFRPEAAASGSKKQ
jgi:hypothetical protein